MRSYNVHVEDPRRRDLYPYAARAVVDTAGDPGLQQHRARLCLRWAKRHRAPPPARVRVLRLLLRSQGPEVDAIYAARGAAADPGRHREALALLDELTAIGEGDLPNPRVPAQGDRPPMRSTAGCSDPVRSPTAGWQPAQLRPRAARDDPPPRPALP